MNIFYWKIRDLFNREARLNFTRLLFVIFGLDIWIIFRACLSRENGWPRIEKRKENKRKSFGLENGREKWMFEMIASSKMVITTKVVIIRVRLWKWRVDSFLGPLRVISHQVRKTWSISFQIYFPSLWKGNEIFSFSRETLDFLHPLLLFFSFYTEK